MGTVVLSRERSRDQQKTNKSYKKISIS